MKDVTPKDFEKEVLKSKTPVLVDFWATYCGPCKGIAKVLESIESERALKVVKANVQTHPELAQEYQIMSVPTLMVFSGGKPIGSIVGAGTKAAIEKRLDQILK